MTHNYEIDYKDDGCCLHPCPALECPEPICFLDYSGYKKTWPKYRQASDMIKSGETLQEVSRVTGISIRRLKDFLENYVTA